ncbi:MAG: adenosylcobinamide-phosphate synthase CbiB [Desulfarculaceae bacterium]|nr:adenosylcobinamide-phosphate synthase CbiB [Desulfarculaceae bacterium]
MPSDLFPFILFSAFVLDFFFKDPPNRFHPVVYMGYAVSILEKRFRKLFLPEGLQGVILAVLLIVGVWLLFYVLLRVCYEVGPIWGNTASVITLYFAFSAAGLKKAAADVRYALETGDIGKGRKMVQRIVGRQTEQLDKSGIAGAAVESVAENFVDGFLSPLFFAALGGPALAMAYKMVNTLDSMIGYRNDTYIRFGKAAARIDDAANFIPARISVVVIALASTLLSGAKAGLRSVQTAVTQGRLQKSPNAGYPEAAFAGALEIRLAGPAEYHGILVEKPYIGVDFPPPGPGDVKRACDLMMLSSFVSALFFSFFVLFV